MRIVLKGIFAAVVVFVALIVFGLFWSLLVTHWWLLAIIAVAVGWVCVIRPDLWERL